MPPRKERRVPQSPNFENRSIVTGDNLEVLRGMNEACVDLIYLDPPYNSNRHYSAPVGSAAAGASFKDAWTLDDVDERWLGEIAERNPPLYKAIDAAGDAHGKSMKAYLSFMSMRLLELQRVLKDTGSIFLHVDPTASHYLKVCMDCIFGKDNCRNEIIWGYTGPGSPGMRQFNRKHDSIYWYNAGKTWTFNRDAVRLPHKGGGPHTGGFKQKDGSNMDSGVAASYNKGKIPETHWTDIALAVRSSKERCGYPTQKPIKLLERIIKAASNEGDVVLDPFCGCATACVAAERLGRQWVGIDISDKAADLVVTRLQNELDHDLLKAVSGKIPKVHHVKKFAGKGSASKRIPNQRAYNHPETKRHLFGQQEGACKCCGGKPDFRDFEVDHIVPPGEGGTEDLDNLQLLCGPCNREKSTGLDVDIKSLKRTGRRELRERIQGELDRRLAMIEEIDLAEERASRGMGRAA